MQFKGDFESRVTLGRAQWITLIEANDALATLRIGLTHDPESCTTERHIEFAAVTKVVSEWAEEKDDCMESIIGAHEDQNGNQLRYMFQTEKRELWIWASERALIV